MNDHLPQVSIVIVNHNGKGLLKDCFDSLSSLDYPAGLLDIIMVDNRSRDGSAAYVEKNYPYVRVIRSGTNNYCAANNLAIRRSRADFIALLNNDVRVARPWLAALVKAMETDRTASTAAGKTLFPDGRIQSAGHVEFPYFYFGDRGTTEKDDGRYDTAETMRSVSNSAALYRRKAICDVGLFDENFNMYMEDVDINYRLRKKGWSILYVPQGLSYHILHGSGQSEAERLFYQERNRLLFAAKHFPNEVPRALYGLGQIARFPRRDFLRVIAEVSETLRRCCKKNELERIMKEFQKSVEKINDFRAHCFAIDLDRKTAGFLDQIAERDRAIRDLRGQIARYADDIAGRDAQLNELREALEQVKQQAGKNQTELTAWQAEADRWRKEIAARDEQLRLSLDEAARSVKEIAVRDAQLKALRETLQEVRTAGRDEINRWVQANAARDAELNTLRETLAWHVQQLNCRFADLTVSENEKARCVKELEARNAELKSTQDELEEHKAQLRGSLSQIAVLQEQCARLQEQIGGQAREIEFMRETVRYHAESIKALERQKDEKAKALADEQERLRRMEKEYALYQAESLRQAQESNERHRASISEKDAAISDLSLKLEQSNNAARDLETRIRQQKAEIDRIYDSETYRLIVRPVIWPMFSFVKKIRSLVRVGAGPTVKRSKRGGGVSIAHLSAPVITARYLRDNQYMIKLVNTSTAPQEVKLFMDFWPSQNRYHPQRHYGFFSAMVCLPAKESVDITFTYDWDAKAVFRAGFLQLEKVDSWRGEMRSPELYQVHAYLYAKEDGRELDDKMIIQKLQL